MERYATLSGEKVGTMKAHKFSNATRTRSNDDLQMKLYHQQSVARHLVKDTICEADCLIREVSQIAVGVLSGKSKADIRLLTD